MAKTRDPFRKMLDRHNLLARHLRKDGPRSSEDGEGVPAVPKPRPKPLVGGAEAPLE